MKAIILSVNPPHAGNLVDGIKWVEWRTKPLPKCKVYIYETIKNGGSGLIIGEVVIGESAICDTSRLDLVSDFVKAGKVSSDYISKYAKAHNTTVVYANMVGEAKRYDVPKDITDFKRMVECRGVKGDCKGKEKKLRDCDFFGFDCKFPVFVERPPQSWFYVEEL